MTIDINLSEKNYNQVFFLLSYLCCDPLTGIG